MMPGKLLWGDIMELEAPLEETESQRKERQKALWISEFRIRDYGPVLPL
ncbi:ATP-dependent RNA helicase DDX50 isoform X1 [Prionailurus iriomotensis]